MTKWADITGYSQDEPRPRTPQSWQTTFAWIRVVVTRHQDHAPDVWVLHAHSIGIDCRLSSRGLPEAQAEAIALVRARLEQALAAMPIRNRIRTVKATG